MWWIYVVVIVFLSILAGCLFLWKRSRDKKLYEKLTKDIPPTLAEAEEKAKAENLERQETKEREIEEFFQQEKQEEPQEVWAGLEHYSISDDNDKIPARTNFREEHEDDEDFDDFGDDDLNAKFAEYEKFLRENLNLDDDDLDSDDDMIARQDKDANKDALQTNQGNLDGAEFGDLEDEYAALSKFDFNSLRGKNPSEIKNIISSLPVKAQEILMTDILARKNYDDDDQEEEPDENT